MEAEPLLCLALGWAPMLQGAPGMTPWNGGLDTPGQLGIASHGDVLQFSCVNKELGR